MLAHHSCCMLASVGSDGNCLWFVVYSGNRYSKSSFGLVTGIRGGVSARDSEMQCQYASKLEGEDHEE